LERLKKVFIQEAIPPNKTMPGAGTDVIKIDP
jgi:hypothetical protein